MRAKRFYAAVLLTAAFFSLDSGINALWIPIKAELAQVLIARSWQQLLDGDTQAKPWPWADTRSAGKLIVPHLEIEQYILEGNSGRNLAFGPVFVDADIGGSDRVISGHRDTHFSFMEQLKRGDRIRIETPAGVENYTVEHMEVVDSTSQELVLEPSIRRLSLVTCYPFETTQTGGALRYVVTALPLPSNGSG